MSEQFRVLPMKGYEGTHLITSDGKVFRKTRLGGEVHKSGYSTYITKTLRGNWLKPQYNRRGYTHIIIGKPRKTKIIHRLVAQTFLPNPNNLSVVNHKNGIKDDNRIENLEWCTQEHNIRHAFAMGLNRIPIGDENKHTKVRDIDIKRIRDIYKTGISQRVIADKYGIDQSHVSRVVNFHKREKVQ